MYRTFTFFTREVPLKDCNNQTAALIVLAPTENIATTIFFRIQKAARKSFRKSLVFKQDYVNHPFKHLWTADKDAVSVSFHHMKTGRVILSMTATSFVQAIGYFKDEQKIKVLDRKTYAVVNHKYVVVFGSQGNEKTQKPMTPFLIRKKKVKS